MQRNGGKQFNGKDQRPRQENWRYQRNISSKDGHDKDRSCKDLIEAENIKKRWQEYTDELSKKGLHEPDNHNGVIIQLGIVILEYMVKWALGSIAMSKDSGGDGIPAELF